MVLLCACLLVCVAGFFFCLFVQFQSSASRLFVSPCSYYGQTNGSSVGCNDQESGSSMLISSTTMTANNTTQHESANELATIDSHKWLHLFCCWWREISNYTIWKKNVEGPYNRAKRELTNKQLSKQKLK